jgi:hypothetical protein
MVLFYHYTLLKNNLNILILILIFLIFAPIILTMQRQIRQIVECPVCDTTLQVSELSCPGCQTQLKGHFPTPPLAQLSATHQEFICTFIQCRGVIRDVEEVLGISYPTVRARLDAVVEALQSLSLPVVASPVQVPRLKEMPLPKEEMSEARQRELLRLVESGDLDPALAAEALRNRNLL